MQRQPSEPEIQVEIQPADLPEFAALVRLCGEHDLASGGELRAALTPIQGNVLVDLSECSFIDSTTISVLIVDHQARSRAHRRLELLVPPENMYVKRTLEVCGVAKLVGLRSSRI
jgi:anti-anti-sigma factor